jgi:glycosyltransferase involved in cell wall biosynthesis
MAELIDDSVGALAEEQTAESLANAIEKAARCTRSECRHRVESHFSLPVMVDRYEELYMELAV